MSDMTVAAPRRRTDARRADAGPSTRRLDVTGFVTIWLVLLFGINARQVVGPLGAIGTPALLFAALGAATWWVSRISPSLEADHGLQPMRIAMYVLGLYSLASFARAQTRLLTPLEQSGSMRGLIMWAVLIGLALLVMDGVRDLERLGTMLFRLVVAAAFLAALGIAQFVTGDTLQVAVPGLSLNADLTGVGARSIFNRPAGTTMHPIEYSVVLGSLLPLAAHFALESPRGSRRRSRGWVALVVIGLGIPLSLSRSGILVLVVSLGVVALAWNRRRLANAAILALAYLPLLWLLVDGLVGTLLNLFTNLEDDSSITARIEDFPRIMALVSEYPWFGRGLGTFSVQDYLLVDNEIYVSMVELGIVGVCIVVAVLALGALLAIDSRLGDHAAPDSRHLGFAIAAGIAGLTVSMVTFDAFFYHVYSGVLFLLLGASGALWRLCRRGAEL